MHPSVNKINPDFLPQWRFYSILDYEFTYSQTIAEKKKALLDHIVKDVFELENVESVYFIDDQRRNIQTMEEYLGPYSCILVVPTDIFRMRFASYPHIVRLIKLIKSKQEGIFSNNDSAQFEQTRFTPRIGFDC